MPTPKFRLHSIQYRSKLEYNRTSVFGEVSIQSAGSRADRDSRRSGAGRIRNVNCPRGMINDCRFKFVVLANLFQVDDSRVSRWGRSPESGTGL